MQKNIMMKHKPCKNDRCHLSFRTPPSLTHLCWIEIHPRLCVNSAPCPLPLAHPTPSSFWIASWTWWRRRDARWPCCGGARKLTARSSTTGSGGTAMLRSWRRAPPVGSRGSRARQRRTTQHQVGEHTYSVCITGTKGHNGKTSC